VPKFAELAALCKQRKVPSLELMTLVGRTPVRNGARGWAVEHRPDQHLAFDESGRVWDRCETLLEAYQKFWGGHRYVYLIAVFGPLPADAPLRIARGFETDYMDLDEIVLNAAAEVVAGRATPGCIPLDAAHKRRLLEEYGYNA
jgi:hypothetical protein